MSRRITSLALVAAAALLVAAPRFAAAELPAPTALTVSALVGDHMVVQQGRPVRLAGSASPGRAVRAALGPSRGATKADAAGHWLLSLPPLAAGGPFELVIDSDSHGAGAGLRFDDVWVGEVWIASGQSNMELPLTRTKGIGEGAAGGCPGLRLFIVPHATAVAPKTDVDGRWQPCDA